MPSPELPVSRTPYLVSNVLLTIAMLLIVLWIWSWFMTPRPPWVREVTLLALLLATSAGVLRRRADAARRPPPGYAR